MFDWNGWARRQQGGAACWGAGEAAAWWNSTLAGRACNANWHEGSGGWPHFSAPAPALLGFDDTIGWHCSFRNGWGRRMDAATPAVSRTIRRLQDRDSCNAANRNILLLFGNNVHGTGTGYNECRNVEWQLCAALGRLPGQGSDTIIFARAPNTLFTDGDRSLGTCGGFAPRGCNWDAYTNDDIFFLEVCLYSMICANADELFRIEQDEDWHCVVSPAGFRRLQRLLVGNPVLGPSAPPPPRGACESWCNEWTCGQVSRCGGCRFPCQPEQPNG